MNPAPRPASAPRLLSSVWFSALVIVAAGLAAYANSLSGPFVFDDPSSITTNPTIRQLWPLSGPLTPPRAALTVQGRPVLNFSLALNYAVGGDAVRGYHIANLAIHLAAALTLFGILRRTFLRTDPEGRIRPAAENLALVIAVLWAVHPLQTQAVTYVIQRAESLMAFFYLATLYGFIRAVESTAPARWFALSIAACFLGMGTKEVMVSAPVIVLLYDRAFVAGNFAAAWRARWPYYAGLLSSWLLLGWLVVGTGGNRGGASGFNVGIAWWDYALTQFVAVAHDLRLALWPQPLVFEYGTFWVTAAGQVLLQAALVLTLATATLWAMWKRPPLGLLGALFFAVLSVTSIVPGTTQMIVEHRMYLPLAAVITGLVLAIHRIVRALPPRLWLMPAVPLALLTHARNADYADERRLWRDTVAKRPGNALAREMHAQALERVGNTDLAILERTRALKIFPGFAVANCNLGDTLTRSDRAAEAIPHYEAAIRSQPNYADAHNGLGSALAQLGRVADSLEHFRRALAIAPEFAEAQHNLANALLLSGQAAEAAPAFARAVQLARNNPRFRFNYGNLLVRLDRKKAAREQFSVACALAPNFVEARANLGAVLLDLGEGAAARAEFARLVEESPEQATAQLGLGEAYYVLRQYPEATAAYRRALELDPSLDAARTALRRIESVRRP